MPDWSARLKARAAEVLATPTPPVPEPTPPAAAVRDARLERWDRRGCWQDLEPIPWPRGCVGRALDERRRCRCGRAEAICEWLPFCHLCAGEMLS